MKQEIWVIETDVSVPILRHYQGYIINDKKRFVKRLSWNEFA